MNAMQSSMNPPCIPPLPPPPAPLSMPPSRARMQLAARLAMNKRHQASGDHSTTSTADETGSATFSLPTMSASERLRNPFADEEDDDGSGSESEEEEAGSSGGWQRGSWWRGVVHASRKPRREREEEKFGDGRDDESDTEDRDTELEDDEEFGDFAMAGDEGGESVSAASGIEPERERMLFKPLPLHPSSNGKSGASGLGSLWPFSGPVLGSRDNKRDSRPAQGSDDDGDMAEEAVQVLCHSPECDTLVDEDGNEIDRTVEAKRRTSIEDADEDDIDNGLDVIVARAS